MRVGVWIYGIATFLTGVLDIVWGDFDTSHQPIQALGKQVAGDHMLAYIAGVWLAVAGIAIVWRSTARIGAVLSGAIYLVFALLWIPRLIAIVHVFGFRIGAIVFGLGGIGAQVLCMAPAAFIYATTGTEDQAWTKRASIAGRWMLGVPPILFALGHLINLSVYARIVPHWIPFPTFWAAVTGIAFLLAGSAIVSGIQDVLAARLLALMLLLFEATVEIPPVFARVHSLPAWGGAVYNVTAIGACWIFARFVLSHRKEERADAGIHGERATSRQDPLVA
jgi:uncharacterized membrane protein